MATRIRFLHDLAGSSWRIIRGQIVDWNDDAEAARLINGGIAVAAPKSIDKSAESPQPSSVPSTKDVSPVQPSAPKGASSPVPPGKGKRK